MMTDDQILEVVAAHKEGKKIQFKTQLLDWRDCANNEPAWEFTAAEYRVAPEPRKPREWIVVSVNNEIYSQFDGSFQEGQWFRVREVLE